jgi:hypothetical protein
MVMAISISYPCVVFAKQSLFGSALAPYTFVLPLRFMDNRLGFTIQIGLANFAGQKA